MLRTGQSWKVKVFPTRKARDLWIKTNGHNYQVVEIFVNNTYALEVKKLREVGGK